MQGAGPGAGGSPADLMRSRHRIPKLPLGRGIVYSDGREKVFLPRVSVGPLAVAGDS